MRSSKIFFLIFGLIPLLAQCKHIASNILEEDQSTFSTTAIRVYGQLGSFVSSTANNGGITADSLYKPNLITVDSTGLYVSDTNNNRVLYYAGTSITASRVYGQFGSFGCGAMLNNGSCVSGTASASNLKNPYGVALDSGGLYIADQGNNRVLYFPTGSTTATRVYGQSVFTTTGASTTASGLNSPAGLAHDGTGLYVADYSNNRVLYFPGTSTTATRVYGQSGSFTSFTGLVTPTADSLLGPYAVAADSAGVYIADSANNRVLYYSGMSTTATRVYGQSGNFNTQNRNQSGVNAASLYQPGQVLIESSGIFIADSSNNRVFYYKGASTAASQVYGQNGAFNRNSTNGVSATSLWTPIGVAIYNNTVYIADFDYNRVLAY